MRTTGFKKNLISIFTLTVFFILALACNPSKKTFHNADNWIPDDFNPAKHTLLIQKFFQAKTQEKAEAYMSKYPYSYEFVSLTDIYNVSEKYTDTAKYRYALISNVDNAVIVTSTSSMAVSGTDFGFYDRQLRREGPKAKKGSSNALMTFKPIINTIIKHAR